MNLEVDVCELGKILKEIEKNYELNILVKSNLSGGWMTITGKASIEKHPYESESGCSSKKDNIIHIRIKEDKEDGVLIKITGAKDKKFNVDISSGKYKEISKVGLNIDMIETNENETKLRIDENIIFTIKTNAEKINELINQ